MKKASPIQHLVLLSLFAAIIFMLAFTNIGYIQLGIIKATIIHIPVIVGSILLGSRSGAFLGFLFGITSLISNSSSPGLLSFAFSPFIPVPGTDQGSIMALIICFIPRILVGIVPYHVFRMFHSLLKGKMRFLSFAIAGILGSITNTILVMGGIYLLFKDVYASAMNIQIETVYKAVLTIIFTNGIPEALLAGVLVSALCKALLSSQQVRDMIDHI